MIRLRDVGRSYSGPRVREVLAGVDLDVAGNERVAIFGESGVGKSTLLNLIAGLDRPDTGSVEVGGVALAALDDDALTAMRREKIGFVFQAFHVLPYLNVEQNVALPLALLGRRDRGAQARVVEMLAAVHLADRAASLPGELSGGELQRVAIARALVHRPAIVLADEPTGNLDPLTAAGVVDLLYDQMIANRAAGVIVTHSRAVAARADRVLELTAAGLRPAPRALDS